MPGMDFDLFLTATAESISSEDYVVATYLIGAHRDADILQRASMIGLE